MHALNYVNPEIFSLSLSSVCNAQCIWCPIGQRLITSDKSKFMPMEVVDKILKDLDGKKVFQFFFADNGEPLLNPRFKEIVSKIHESHPEASLWMASNFSLMDDDMARFIIDRFVSVGVNIDGITEEGYYTVKQLPLNFVLSNLINFLRIRSERTNWSSPSVPVSIITQPRYYMEIGEPEKITIPDETIKVASFLRGILEPSDQINSSVVLTWAERRKRNKPRDGSFFCTNVQSVGLKCSIDTDGNVVGCCEDYDSELKFGNVMERNVYEIWNCTERQRFLSLIIQRRFSEIGLPCSNCQD